MKRVALLGLIALSACAHAPEPAAPSGPLVVALTPGLPAPPQAKLYAACMSEAAATSALARERDGGTLRFTCTGPAAKAFYDGLEQWSPKIGAEYVEGGRTWRFTQKLIKDSYGVDGCSSDGAGRYECVVILAAGQFIEQMDYRLS